MTIQLSSPRQSAPQCSQRNNKDAKSNKSYDKKNDCKRNHSKKKSNEAMHNDQSSSSSAGNSYGRSQSCSRSPLHSHSCSRSCSCSSSRSYNNHHVDQDNHKPSAAPKHGYLYSPKSDDSRCIHHLDKSDTVFATLSAPKAKKKRTQK